MNNPVIQATDAATNLVDKASNVIQKGADAGRKQLVQQGEQLKNNVKEVVSIQERSADAFRETTKILVEGSSQATILVSDLLTASVIQALEAGKLILTARSPSELLDLHQANLTAAVDNWRTHSEKLSDLSSKVVGEAIAPIKATVADSVNRAQNLGLGA